MNKETKELVTLEKKKSFTLKDARHPIMNMHTSTLLKLGKGYANEAAVRQIAQQQGFPEMNKDEVTYIQKRMRTNLSYHKKHNTKFFQELMKLKEGGSKKEEETQVSIRKIKDMLPGEIGKVKLTFNGQYLQVEIPLSIRSLKVENTEHGKLVSW